MFGDANIECQWLQDEEYERADFIELVVSSEEPNDLLFDYGHLSGGQEITGKLKEANDTVKNIGGLRIIICERHRYAPLDFPLQRTTFEAICKKYKLSPRTLQSFDLDAGTFMRSYCYDEEEEISGIDIIMKAPQKREIGNYALSMHYEMETCVTTALLYGTDVLVCDEVDKHRIASVNRVDVTDAKAHWLSSSIATELPVHLDNGTPEARPSPPAAATGSVGIPGGPHLAHRSNEEPHQVDDKTFFSYICDPSTTTKTPRTSCLFRPKLRDILKSEPFRVAVKYPLALPCALLEDHLRHAQKHCEHDGVYKENWEIMNTLGMRGEGADQNIFWIGAMRPNYERPVNSRGEKQDKETPFDAKKLTARIDRQILRILFCEQAPRWNRECSEFLLETAKELRGNTTKHDLSIKVPYTASDSGRFRQGLQHNIATSQSLSIHLSTMKENMSLQLNVCSSITGQTLNESNMKIALQTSQDSTSMKILAFITALFLPASFIATMFGMDLFQSIWGDGERWWIYLVTALPLTIIVLVGWAVWWKIEISLHDREMQLRDFWRGSKAKLWGRDEFVKPNRRKAERDRERATVVETERDVSNGDLDHEKLVQGKLRQLEEV